MDEGLYEAGLETICHTPLSLFQKNFVTSSGLQALNGGLLYLTEPALDHLLFR
jgi:hypothetical protein